MKRTLASILIHPVRPATLALCLLLGLTLAASRLAAADTTNAIVPAPITPPTKLVVPPEWKVTDEPRDYKYEGLPLNEVTIDLQEKCKHGFDVLMPRTVVFHAPPPGQPAEAIETGGLSISLRLKGVSIIEVFQAMNMVFEIEHTPLRWELVMNGHRPVAMLRELVMEPPPAAAGTGGGGAGTAQSVGHCVAYVGNLLGTPDTGRVMPETLCEILEQTANETFPDSSTRKIHFHRGGELVVMSGTDEELRLLSDVLRALKEKADDQRKGGTPGEQAKPAKK